MIKGIFIFIGIMVAIAALGAGDILAAIVAFVLCTLVGEGLEKMIFGNEKGKEKTGKRETTEQVVSNPVVEKKEESNSETAKTEITIEEEPIEWKCSECGTFNRNEFCEECGAKKPIKEERYCTNCGAKLEEGQKYCEDCGTKVE